MRKSNVVVFALLILLSAILLWSWYYLGLNRVDYPLDLVLSIVWWIVLLLSVAIIIKLEKTRRRRIRTVYAGERAAFNSEAGIFPLPTFADVEAVQATIASVLCDLEYDFTREDFPEPKELKVRYFVRTKKFKAKEYDEDEEQRNARLAAAPESGETSEAVEGNAALHGSIYPWRGANTNSGTTTSASSRRVIEPVEWVGEVVMVGSDEPESFDTSEELAEILSRISVETRQQ
ncbi:hypothetical protein GMI69_06605 [Eggerthellaceae bacterium zg-887]|uniref:hypothetical protein n=1 Tax=Xiamenia xianingshaonis TaxID=2682776 RepID=UPI00140BF1D0|nr:hypothetical protein [Xiamenia xianingshaonis]NHM16328.1 hypothetical protein [Xiamenia xianingshaonis]